MSSNKGDTLSRSVKLTIEIIAVFKCEAMVYTHVLLLITIYINIDYICGTVIYLNLLFVYGREPSWP
jgi:hypothetical protein